MIGIHQRNMIKRLSVLAKDQDMYLHPFVIIVLVDLNTVYRHQQVNIKRKNIVCNSIDLSILASDDGSESESSDAAYSSNNRTDSSGFYGTRGGRSPALEIDPFKKPVHPSSSFYKRPHYDHK